MNEDIQVTAEPRPTVGYSEIPDWITEASSHAYKLYGVLRGYADNRTRKAWPSLATLAARMGFKKPESVSPYVAELEAMGAISVTRSKAEDKTKNVNIYRLLWDRPGGTPAERGGPVEGSGGTPPQRGRGTPPQRGRGTPPQRGITTPTELHPTEPLFSTADADAPPAPQPEAEAEATANEGPNAGTLMAVWLEHCGAVQPPSRIKGHMSREIKALLDEGIPYEHVSNGLAEWHHRGEMGPSALPSFVYAVMQRQASAAPMPNTAPAPNRGAPRVATADRNIQDTLSLLSPEYRAQMEAGMNRPAGELEA